MDALREIGLQDGEIKVYLALLRVEDATASQITHDTGLHRSNVYDILEKLQEKGLASTVTKNSVRHYRASPPERIIDYLKEKEEKILSVLPSLLSRYATAKQSCRVEIYKGKEGLKTVLNDILRTGRDYLLFGHLEFEKLLPGYVAQFVRRTDGLRMRERAILERGTRIAKTKLHDYRYVSREHLFPTAVIVYGDKTAIFIWEEPYNAILIESATVAASYRRHFALLWRIAEAEARRRNQLQTSTGTNANTR